VLFSARHLRVDIPVEAGVVHAVRDVSFDVSPGEMLALVGESGCGKSMTALSLLGLSREIPGAQVTGSILFHPRKKPGVGPVDLLRVTLGELRSIRGNEIGMVFQDPMSSLNPVLTVGYQIMEPLMLHRRMPVRAARAEAVNLLRAVGIPDPEQRINHFPHQLSGGMQQRAMIAMALSCQPSLLLADEPTTALDVTIQAQIMSLVTRLKEETAAAVILITHDLSVVAGTCSRILVMYAGRIVEEAAVDEFFHRPRHPYSRALLASLPRVDRRARLQPIPGQPPELTRELVGCPYAERCESADGACSTKDPELVLLGEARVACFHPYT